MSHFNDYSEYDEAFDPLPGPGLIAHVSIVIARAGDPLVRERMDLSPAPVEISAMSLDDLALRVARYGANAVKSIGDPGYGNFATARFAALRTGVDEQSAAQGIIFDRDAG